MFLLVIGGNKFSHTEDFPKWVKSKKLRKKERGGGERERKIEQW